MALVLYGFGVAQMSGKLGGSVFARNPSGNYVRNHTIPVNPDTALQQRARAALALLTERWNEVLSVAQRTAWNLYGSSVAMLNRLGATIYLSGFNHYIRSNSFLAQYGLTLIDAGPTTFTLPDQDPTLAITLSEAVQQAMCAFDDTLAWASEDNAYLTCLFGKPQNADRNFFAGPWKGVRYLAGNLAVPLVSPLPLGSLFEITEGQKVWCQFRIYRADGRVSNTWTAENTVLAAFP